MQFVRLAAHGGFVSVVRWILCARVCGHPNVLNMTSTSFDAIVVNNVSSVSASPGSGSWVFSPNPTTGIFQDVLSVNPTVKTAIVYFGTTSEPSGPGESQVLFFYTGSEGVLDMFCSDDATINCPSTGPTEWTVSSRSGISYITIVRTGTDTVSTGLLWIVVELSALHTRTHSMAMKLRIVRKFERPKVRKFERPRAMKDRET